MCGFSAGFMRLRGRCGLAPCEAGRCRLAISSAGCGAGYLHLLRGGLLTRTLCGVGAGQQLWPWGGCGSEISAHAELYGLQGVQNQILHVCSTPRFTWQLVDR